MEITDMPLIRPSEGLFKIDLIVWKCTKEDLYRLCLTQFKIDLIVWKFYDIIIFIFRIVV